MLLKLAEHLRRRRGTSGLSFLPADYRSVVASLQDGQQCPPFWEGLSQKAPGQLSEMVTDPSPSRVPCPHSASGTFPSPHMLGDSSFLYANVHLKGTLRSGCGLASNERQWLLNVGHRVYTGHAHTLCQRLWGPWRQSLTQAPKR